MDYFLTEQQKTIKGLARRIAEEKVLPVRAELDEKEKFPWEIVKELAAADMFRVFIPEEYDGLGGGCLDLCLVTEELSRVCCGIATTYAVNALGCMTLIEYGSEEQKRKYLPDIASGKRLAAFAITEATAGSDSSNIKTTAEKVAGGYLLNGTKQFITNGGEAEIYTIIALTDKDKGARGASAIIVEKDTPGFTFGKKEKKMGIRASSTSELVFHNCLVPEANLIGKPGHGFIQAMRLFDKSRPGIGAEALGLCQGAMEAAVDYAAQRIQFDVPIITQPVVQQMLADMAIQTEAARALVYAAARYVDSGAKDVTEYSAAAKVFASDAAMKITVDAVQVCGGTGYMRDYPVEKMMRDAKILQIYEGTNQILRNAIAMNLRKEEGQDGMNIVVCLKQVPGTTEVKIDPVTNSLIRQGIPNIINPFDTYALEEAVRIKDKNGGKVTVLTMGPPQADAALREAVSLGADDTILLSDRAFATADTWATANTLVGAIKKIGQYDIIICGRQTVDGDTGQVGPEMAEMLGVPFIAYVSKIEEIKDKYVRVTRAVEDGHEVLEAALPAVITVAKEINIPRLPSLRGIMKSKSHKITTWSNADLGLDPNSVGLAGSSTQVIKVFFPKRVTKAEILTGDVNKQVDTLIEKLRETRLI